MADREAVIVNGARTAMVKFGGALRTLPLLIPESPLSKGLWKGLGLS